MGSLRTLKRRGQRQARRARAVRRADPNYKPMTVAQVDAAIRDLLPGLRASFEAPSALTAYLRKSR